MSSSRHIVIQGWLTKSPPSRRIWRTKWRRRWFALRQSGELPGQYFLEYYAERNCRRLKGTINLDLCEQVDAGLHMERGSVCPDMTLRGSVFTIQTNSRVYHLEADTDKDMEKWVNAICRVCGLKAADRYIGSEPVKHESVGTMTTEKFVPPEDKGVYIPISECVTGARAKVSRAFTFEPSHILASGGTVKKRVNIGTQTPTPHFQVTVTDYSENESNVSDEESKSLDPNSDQNCFRDRSLAQACSKMSINPKRNGHSEDGPPVPPRPPKTFAMTKDSLFKEHHGYQGPKIQEPVELQDVAQALPLSRTPRAGPSSPRAHCSKYTDDEEEYAVGQNSMQYFNLPMSLPPAVDRALKPRPSSHSMGPLIVSPSAAQFIPQPVPYEPKDTLQYLDLDLHTSQPPSSKNQDVLRRRTESSVGNSLPNVENESAENESAYRSVDFLKTEAFLITSQDAEASRNISFDY